MDKQRRYSNRSEYINGYVEIIVFAASIIHNAIGEIDWRAWLLGLPGHPSLQVTGRRAGLNNLVKKASGSMIPYREGTSDDDKIVLAADIHLGSLLHDDPWSGGIIFEAAYSETLNHAREKTRTYLWDSDEPRPTVVVLISLEEKGSREGYRDVDVHFEVHRRLECSTDRETKTFETGVS